MTSEVRAMYAANGSVRWSLGAAALAVLCAAGCATFEPPLTPRRDSGPADGGPLNNCDEGMFVDRTDAAAERVVTFGGTVGSAFSPRCVTVAAGQTVTFTGGFTFHPLHRGSGPTRPDTGSPNNPIPETVTGDRITVTFPAAGAFPFHCGIHFGAGMTGVIRVR